MRITWAPQVAEEVFSLSRLVRTFGTERREGERYLSFLRRLARISVRQAAAYFMYLSTASALYYVTKASAGPLTSSMWNEKKGYRDTSANQYRPCDLVSKPPRAQLCLNDYTAAGVLFATSDVT